MKGRPLLSPCPKGFRMCHCLFQLQPPHPRIEKLLICSEPAKHSIRLLSPSLKQQFSLVQTDNFSFFLPATSDTRHEPTQTSTDRCSTGGGRAPFPPVGSLQQQGRSRARGEHTHSTHCTRGEHKCLQQNLRESTLRESSSPAPPALPPQAGLDPPPTHPSLLFLYCFLPELKNDSEASAGTACVGHSSWRGTSCSGLQAVQEKWPHKCISPKQRPLRDLGLFSSHRPLGEAHQDLTGDAQWV